MPSIGWTVCPVPSFEDQQEELMFYACKREQNRADLAEQRTEEAEQQVSSLRSRLQLLQLRLQQQEENRKLGGR
jgi:hypothetical protein